MILDFLNFIFKSNNHLAEQNSFVSDLVHTILHTKNNTSNFDFIELYRKNLLADSTPISETLPGAGSRINKTKSIKQIAKNSSKPKSQSIIIANLAKYIQAENIIELGTSFGITTSYIVASCPTAKISTIEGSKQIFEIAKNHFKLNSLENIFTINGNFDEELKHLNIPSDGWDLVYIDGNHTFDATIRYYNYFANKLSIKGVIVFDDIYWSEGMKEAWKIINQSEQISLSIDFFVMGMVWQNTDFLKKHYRIFSKQIF